MVWIINIILWPYRRITEEIRFRSFCLRGLTLCLMNLQTEYLKYSKNLV